MKKSLIGLLVICSFGLGEVALAQPAEIDPILDSNITTTTVRMRIANVRAAKKFKFQLWDKRAGRADYRKVDTFFRKRLYKKRTHVWIKVSSLHQNRDYRIRYKPIYFGDREGVWSDYALFRTKQKAIYFTLDDEGVLSDSDVPYLYIDPASTTAADTGIQTLTEEDDGTWSFVLPGVAVGDEIQYYFGRNYEEGRGFEEFSPDDLDTRRTISVGALPLTRDITITDWRWLDPSQNNGDVTSGGYIVTGRSTWLTAAVLDTTRPINDENYIDATLQSMVDIGITHVILPYAARTITAGDPVTTNQTVVGYLGDAAYVELAGQITAAGMSPMMQIDFPINADNEDTILQDMAGTHTNSYYDTYLTRWREAMNDGVDFAIANNIDYVILNTDFYDFTFQDDAQEADFSSTLENDMLPTVASGYSGILTTADLSTDSDFSWYGASEIDWLGDTLYPDLTNSSTPTVADMYAAATTLLATDYEPVHTTYNKPVFFSALGVFSVDGGAGLGETVAPDAASVDPDRDNDTYTVDAQEQADAYEALFSAIADVDYVYGAASPHYNYTELQDKSANIHGKTAGLVWARWAQLLE